MSDPVWPEPTDRWGEREAAKLKAGDFILDSAERRVKVLASYSASAGNAAWYVEVYEHGEPTRRIGCEQGEMFKVEVRG